MSSTKMLGPLQKDNRLAIFCNLEGLGLRHW
jgi:hypothetical protein